MKLNNLATTLKFLGITESQTQYRMVQVNKQLTTGVVLTTTDSTIYTTTAIIINDKFDVIEVAPPEGISKEFVNFDATTELPKTFVFLVEQARLSTYINFITALRNSLNNGFIDLYKVGLTIKNGQPIEALEDEVFLMGIIRQFLVGEAKIVGPNIHMNGGKFILPNYKDFLIRSGAITVATTEVIEDELYY